MERLRYTLVADGPSDRGLMPILRWLLAEHYRLPWRPVASSSPSGLGVYPEKPPEPRPAVVPTA